MFNRNEGNVVIHDARILFRNFEGKEGQFNRRGDRNFCVLLDFDMADKLVEDGWAVKKLKAREEGDEPQPYLPVSVSFEKGRPPKLVLVSSRGRNTLGVDECEIFDWIDIANVDLIIRPYHWEVNGKAGTKAYLKSMFVTVEEDELDLKYADIPEANIRHSPEED